MDAFAHGQTDTKYQIHTQKDDLLRCAAEGVLGRALRSGRAMRPPQIRLEAKRAKKLMFIGASLQRETFYELVRLLGYTHVIDVNDKYRGLLKFTVGGGGGGGVSGVDSASLELIFQWQEVTRGGGVNWPFANSSVYEYELFVRDLHHAIQAQGIGQGDIVVVATSPYDLVHRPLATAEQGAELLAIALAEVAHRKDAPTVVFRNQDANHLPWISYGRSMRTPQDGMTVARGEQVSRWYTRAMRKHRVHVLETFATTVVRGDMSRDGIHYRTTRELSTNTVSRTVLQLLLQALCATGENEEYHL